MPRQPAGADAGYLARLCDALLASLPRRDQRRYGTDYVRGLLAARGRKSIRNISRHVGGRATEQRLHHFIADSTWDWRAVRQALASHLIRTAPPRIWVVRCIVIPKAGDRAAGATRRYYAQLDRTVHAQIAAGLWAATSEYCVPVNWCLHLPRPADSEPVPGAVPAESLEECALRSFTEMMPLLPPAPVLFDARFRLLDPVVLAALLGAARVPAIVRIEPDVDLVSDDPADACQPAFPRPAAAILNSSRHRSVPAAGADGSPCAVTATEVAFPHRAGAQPAGPGRLRLLGITRPGDPRPSGVWLTSLQSAWHGELPHLTGLAERLEPGMLKIAEDVGIGDFIGRSYAGWHRHMTLASIAHTIRSQGRPVPDAAHCQATPRPRPVRKHRSRNPAVSRRVTAAQDDHYPRSSAPA